MFFPRLCLLVCSLVLPVSAWAAELGLFEFERVVPDQAAAARKDAVMSGLEEVLIRVTGDRKAPSTDAGKAVLARAAKLLLQYDYFLRPPVLPPPPLPPPSGKPQPSPVGVPPPVPEPATNAPPPPPVDELVLRGRFDAVALTRALNQAGFAVWGRERPKVTVVLMLRDGLVRPLAMSEIPLEWFTMQDIGRQRGLRFMTRSEPMTGAAATMWDSAPADLARELNLPPEQVLLFARITHVGDTWGVGASLVQDGVAIQEWDHYSATLIEALVATTQQTVDVLAGRYATHAVNGQQNYIGLRVQGVTTLEDYARVQRYLQQLDATESVELMSVRGDAVVYRVRVRGDTGVLSRAMQLGRVLSPQNQTAVTADGGEWSGEFLLDYQLIPPPTTPSAPAATTPTTQPAQPLNPPIPAPAAQPSLVPERL